jgi:hypothetical protein
MRSGVLVMLVVLCPASGFAQSYDRYHELLDHSVRSPAFWIEAAGAGVIDQANTFPREWEVEPHSFPKRTTARIGQAFVSSIMESGAAVPFRQHVGYEHCSCTGLLRRTGHAIWRTFVQRKVNGHLALNVPLIAAKYGSAAVANAWYPESYRRADVLAQGSFALGTAAGLNLLAEFSPDLLRAIHLH